MSRIKSHIYELTGPRQLVVREESIDLNTIGGNEVVAQTLISTISPGTEIAAYVGLPPLRPMKVFPRVIGYCNVAKVLAVGRNVTGVAVGDHISTHQSHRSSFRCDQSAVNAVLLRGDDLVAQSTVYLWHLGYYPLLRAKLAPGSNVVVIGMGALGLTSVAASKNTGCRVVAMSNREVARSLSEKFGAESSFCLSDIKKAKRWMEAQFPDVGVDLVVITSNSWNDWRVALELVRDGGALAVVGFPGRGLPPAEFNPLDSQYLYDKELTIYGCGNPPSADVSVREKRHTLRRNYQYLGEMIRLRRLPARDIVSRVVSWDKLENIYSEMAQRSGNIITASLAWPEDLIHG